MRTKYFQSGTKTSGWLCYCHKHVTSDCEEESLMFQTYHISFTEVFSIYLAIYKGTKIFGAFIQGIYTFHEMESQPSLTISFKTSTHIALYIHYCLREENRSTRRKTLEAVTDQLEEHVKYHTRFGLGFSMVRTTTR